MRKFWLIFLGLACLIATFVLMVPPASEQICKQKFEEHYRAKFEQWEMTEKSVNGISIDVSGTYLNGQWSCALSNHPVIFKSGVLHPDTEPMSAFTD